MWGYFNIVVYTCHVQVCYCTFLYASDVVKLPLPPSCLNNVLNHVKIMYI